MNLIKLFLLALIYLFFFIPGVILLKVIGQPVVYKKNSYTQMPARVVPMSNLYNDNSKTLFLLCLERLVSICSLSHKTKAQKQIVSEEIYTIF